MRFGVGNRVGTRKFARQIGCRQGGANRNGDAAAAAAFGGVLQRRRIHCGIVNHKGQRLGHRFAQHRHLHNLLWRSRIALNRKKQRRQKHRRKILRRHLVQIRLFRNKVQQIQRELQNFSSLHRESLIDKLPKLQTKSFRIIVNLAKKRQN